MCYLARSRASTAHESGQIGWMFQLPPGGWTSVRVQLSCTTFQTGAVRRTVRFGPHQYELTDDKGVHVVAYKGDAKATDLYFGKSGSRGQMARIAGKDGVYIAQGYSAYLYTREVKNWRETSILKFEDANAG